MGTVSHGCGMFLVLIRLSLCSGEFYSSTDSMMQLVEMERNLTHNICDFIMAEKLCSEALGRRMQACENTSKDFPEDLEAYVRNPFSAYKLVGQLRRRWTMAEQVARSCSAHEFLGTLSHLSKMLPSQGDLDGIAMSLVRLEAVYGFPQSMRGRETAGQPNVPLLDPDESFHVAMVALQHQQFDFVVRWLWEALVQLDEGVPATVTRKQVLGHLGPLAFQMGNMPLALELTQQTLDLEPSDVQTAHRLQHYRALEQSVLLRDRDTRTPPAVSELLTQVKPPSPSTYESLCRGDGAKMAPERQRTLVCRYSTGGGNPRLIYAPIKEEDEWDQPKIIRYHDLMSEAELEIIKHLSRSKLERATVVDAAGRRPTEQRVAKSAWLSEEEHPVILRVTQMIADVTGLDMKTAEMFQVANYGIGGQYEPHYDSQLPIDADYISRGNRIATILFYLSDVEVGGATVFPTAGAALQPQKGSAILWYNLLLNGDLDLRTLHAGCPVFLGNKWVATKWVRTTGQEFSRKCALSRSD